MKRNFKILSLIIAVMMIFSMTSMVLAVDEEHNHDIMCNHEEIILIEPADATNIICLITGHAPYTATYTEQLGSTDSYCSYAIIYSTTYCGKCNAVLSGPTTTPQPGSLHSWSYGWEYKTCTGCGKVAPLT